MLRSRILMVAMAFVVGAAWADTPDGLIAYWDFEEGSGSTVPDRSGQGHDGTAQDGFFRVENAAPCPGSEFAGYFAGGGWVLVPDADELDPPGDFTLAAWVNTDVTEGYNFMLNKHSSGQNQDGSWMWGATRVPGEDAAQPYFIATPWAYELVGQGRFPHDAWRHLTMTYDDDADTYEFWTHYFDGVEIKLLGYETGTYVIDIANNAQDLGIGAQANQGGVFQGLLDDVCMFDRVLAEGEIHTLVPEPGSLALLAAGSLALLRRRR